MKKLKKFKKLLKPSPELSNILTFIYSNTLSILFTIWLTYDLNIKVNARILQKKLIRSYFTMWLYEYKWDDLSLIYKY